MLGAVISTAKKKAPNAAALHVQCEICMIESISLSPTAVPDTGQSSEQASLFNTQYAGQHSCVAFQNFATDREYCSKRDTVRRKRAHPHPCHRLLTRLETEKLLCPANPSALRYQGSEDSFSLFIVYLPNHYSGFNHLAQTKYVSLSHESRKVFPFPHP